jgi:hypothetical protein
MSLRKTPCTRGLSLTFELATHTAFGPIYYAKDKTTGRAETLGTSDSREAQRLLNAKNQAIEQPHLNVAMARVYLSCKTPEMLERTWNAVMEDMELSYHGPTLKRWRTQMRSAPFQVLRRLKLLETDGTHFLNVLRHPRAGTSAHKWLRILHNRALDLGWLLTPVLARKLWPKRRLIGRRIDLGQKLTRLDVGALDEVDAEEDAAALRENGIARPSLGRAYDGDGDRNVLRRYLDH